METSIQKDNYTFLKFIDFKNITLWDVKRFVTQKINSIFPVVELGTYIKEENTRVKPFEFPNEDFKILGVNNKTGIFDAYIQKGEEIKQPYKKVEIGFLAYNPYRINVGSIGVRTEQNRYEYISPAYVVFSCKKQLNPDFLFKLFSTDFFNKVIRKSTTGSVRQNLTFDILSTLKIPLPDLTTQEQLLQNYYAKIQLAENQEKQADELEKSIDEYLFRELGVKFPRKENKVYGKLQFIQFKELIRWDLLSSDNLYYNELLKTKYPIVLLGEKFNFVNRSWDKRKLKDKYFYYIEIGAIDPVFGITEIKKIEVSEAPSRATQTVKTDDLIIGTTRPYLKKFAIVNYEFDNYVCSSGFSVIEKSNSYDLNFLKHFLMSDFGLEQLKNKMSGGLYPAITEKELKTIEIPFPPLSKQKEISEQIKAWKTEIKALREQAKSNRANAIKEFEEQLFI